MYNGRTFVYTIEDGTGGTVKVSGIGRRCGTVSNDKNRRNLTLDERSACDRQSYMTCLSESILIESRAITSQMGVIMRDAIRKWAYCRCVYSRVVGDPCACNLGTLARAERETLLQVKRWKERLWKEKQIREQNRK